MSSLKLYLIIFISSLFFLAATSVVAQTADIKILNAQQVGSTFSFDIHIEPTNDWGSGTFDKRLGDCSWAFTFNTSGLNNPSITVQGTPVDPAQGYSSSVQILGSRLIVTTEFDLGSGNGVDIVNGTDYQLYSVSLNITDVNLSAELEWDQVNTGIFNIPDETINVGFSGEGDIPLPVSLSAFNSISQRNAIRLEWTTQTEINNSGFEVYRSLEEEGNYQLVTSYINNDSLEGAGTSNSPRQYGYSDLSVETDITYYYRLADVNLAGIRTFHGPISGKIDPASFLPERFSLDQNYPNPFNPETTIDFTLPERQDLQVNATVFDMLGRNVRTLFSGRLETGSHRLKWNGLDDNDNILASGTYVLQLRTATESRSIKMLLLK
ncbi:MAG: FlgD immunoglobulin-like domain containing protein [Calditrichota bacterium]